MLAQDAPAKVNLTLRVGPRRADGYHEIESVVVRASLCDRVAVERRDDGRVTVECDAPGIPADERNLAVRAGLALRELAGPPRGAHIRLTKRIPAGAGLGGGSSNAATTLRLLDTLWETGLDDGALERIGAGIGSDVPFFLHGPCCVIRGRGERIERLSADWAAWAVLLLPPIPLASADVYRAFDRLPPPPARAPLPEQAASTLGMEALFNDLESAAFHLSPELADLAQRAAELAGGPVRMSGSGSTLFRLSESAAAARNLAQRCADKLGVRSAVVQLGAYC